MSVRLMALFTIDEQLCKRDGVCAAECPAGIIEIASRAALPTPSDNAEQLCVKCGHCVAVCTHGAFSHAVMKPGDCPPVQADSFLSAEQAEHFLRARRSIRAYQIRPVERKTLQDLVDIARYAPSGSNSQQVHYLVLDTPDAVRNFDAKIIDLMREAIAQSSPLVDRLRMPVKVRAWEAGKDLITRGAPALILAHAPKNYSLAVVDCSIALTYLDLAAPSFSLGTCWAGYVMIMLSQSDSLHRSLDLPEDHAVFGAMMVGYPTFKYHRLPLRNPARLTWSG
jgi:nitroreductase/NAD-dependent dihydropyrimidine dehydrogenase PreA subunit